MIRTDVGLYGNLILASVYATAEHSTTNVIASTVFIGLCLMFLYRMFKE